MDRYAGFAVVITSVLLSPLAAQDPRNIRTGLEIPTETYADQPYVVQTDDGAWLCVLTTGSGREGQQGQHVVSLRSTDRGKTWSEPVEVEPADGPEASYAVAFKVPSGRIYVFYNHNTDNLRQVKADFLPYRGGYCTRVDTQGYFVFKYSDDHGRTWSRPRWPIPVREFKIDRENPYAGEVRFFWNVGKPFAHDGAAYVPLHKVGRFGYGFIGRSEGVVLKIANLFTEDDPKKLSWETLPDGDIGLRSPSGGGPIAEEQSFAVLSDGAFYCVYRTSDGHPACSSSRDGGHTWSEPQYVRYADGQLIKHPRAANFVWKCRNGKYLYWFHNHGGRTFDDRNPAWLCGGVEADSLEGKVIRWSQPEIVLYDDDPYIRMSYPDLIEDSNEFFLTETQKDIARVHPVPRDLLEGLWRQFENRSAVTKDLILDLPHKGRPMQSRIRAPRPPAFLARDGSRADQGAKDMRAGFAIDLWVTFESICSGDVLLDSRTEAGWGLCLQTTDHGTVEIVMNDGVTENRWDCDRGLLETGRPHHIVVNVDGGPKIITFIIDGQLCDGSDSRQFGWGRFSPNLRDVYGNDMLLIGPHLAGSIHRLRMYSRYLRTSEAIGNYQAGIGRD